MAVVLSSGRLVDAASTTHPLLLAGNFVLSNFYVNVDFINTTNADVSTLFFLETGAGVLLAELAISQGPVTPVGGTGTIFILELSWPSGLILPRGATLQLRTFMSVGFILTAYNYGVYGSILL